MLMLNRAATCHPMQQSTPVPFSCKTIQRFPEAIAILKEEHELRDQLLT